MMASATRWEYMRLSAARRPMAVQTVSWPARLQGLISSTYKASERQSVCSSRFNTLTTIGDFSVWFMNFMADAPLHQGPAGHPADRPQAFPANENQEHRAGQNDGINAGNREQGDVRGRLPSGSASIIITLTTRR